MTKRIRAKHKVDRRLKVNLWGKPKSPFNTRNYPPGHHRQSKKGKPTDYGVQLLSLIQISDPTTRYAITESRVCG